MCSAPVDVMCSAHVDVLCSSPIDVMCIFPIDGMYISPGDVMCYPLMSCVAHLLMSCGTHLFMSCVAHMMSCVTSWGHVLPVDVMCHLLMLSSWPENVMCSSPIDVMYSSPVDVTCIVTELPAPFFKVFTVLNVLNEIIFSTCSDTWVVEWHYFCHEWFCLR